MLVRGIPLVHVNVVHPVLGAELDVDPGLWRRIVEVGPEHEQLAAGGLERAEMVADDILEIVGIARSGGRERHARGPIEERRAGIVECVGDRPRLVIQIRQARGNAGRPPRIGWLSNGSA